MVDRKEAWEKSYRKMKESYPLLEGVSWSTVLSYDSDTFSQVLGDVIKAEGKRSRPGKRPTLSRSLAESEFSKLSGASYSEYEFLRAFRALTHGRTVRGIANKVGLGQTTVHNLLNGQSPTFRQMESIAAAYNKDPSYFLEYRIAYSLRVIEKFLMDSPETATVWYLKMSRKGK